MMSRPGSLRSRVMGEASPVDAILLLGAGASVDAGVPAMEAMFDRFVERLSVDDRAFVDRVLARMSAWASRVNRRPKDVEVLLAALEHYADLADDLSFVVSGFVPPSD